MSNAIFEFAKIDQSVEWFAKKSPHAPCALFKNVVLSYKEVQDAIERCCLHMTRLGIKPGDRVAVLSTPRPEYLILLMAIARTKAIYVGINPRYTPREIAHALELTRPRLLLSLASLESVDYTQVLSQVASSFSETSVLYFNDVASCLHGLSSASADLLGLPSMMSDSQLQASVELQDAQPDNPRHDVAAVVFTSGSTGKPKAAMLTHTGMLHAASVQAGRFNPKQARYLNNLPVNHVGCLMNLTLACLVTGGAIVFQEKFSAQDSLDLLQRHKINVWLQVPTMFQECVQHPNYSPQALRHVKSICAGGGALPAPTIAQLRKIGAPLFVEYGQTETSSSATYSDAGANDDVLANSIGRIDPNFEIRIVTPDLKPCQVEEVGEIQARGKLLFAGYFNDSQATREAFTADGWLRTGDLASFRTDGNISIQGRLKEMIKSGGYNVYPREIELCLEQFPSIKQAVVIGLPDEKYGESVHALLLMNDDPPTTATLREHCRAVLANYKVPKSFRRVDYFPLLANGKIDRIAAKANVLNWPMLA
jgi:acyl-CoA synthetase (AMP-forming)/AMP-acid ligase II